MKTGFDLLLWTTHVTREHFPILAALKDTGFDGVELPLSDGNAAHYREIAAELRDDGLGCTTLTVMSEVANPISPDAAVREAAVQHLLWAIEMTATLGGEVLCGPMHSPVAIFTGRGPTEDEKQRAADVLRRAAEDAQKAGIMLAVEYLNRFESYFLTTAVQARDLVQRVDHPHLRMMYDTFHANIEEKDIAATIADVAASVVHVHVSENDRGTPGTGHVHWDETFGALRRVGYDGWLVIEAFGRGHEGAPHQDQGMYVWRDLSPSAEEVYTKGLHFMKERWAIAATALNGAPSE